MKYLKTYEEQIYVREHNPKMERILKFQQQHAPYPPKFKVGDKVIRKDEDNNKIYTINNLDYNKDINADTHKVIGWEYCLFLNDEFVIWRGENQIRMAEDYEIGSNKYNL